MLVVLRVDDAGQDRHDRRTPPWRRCRCPHDGGVGHVGPIRAEGVRVAHRPLHGKHRAGEPVEDLTARRRRGGHRTVGDAAAGARLRTHGPRVAAPPTTTRRCRRRPMMSCRCRPTRSCGDAAPRSRSARAAASGQRSLGGESARAASTVAASDDAAGSADHDDAARPAGRPQAWSRVRVEAGHDRARRRRAGVDGRVEHGKRADAGDRDGCAAIGQRLPVDGEPIDIAFADAGVGSRRPGVGRGHQINWSAVTTPPSRLTSESDDSRSPTTSAVPNRGDDTRPSRCRLKKRRVGKAQPVAHGGFVHYDRDGSDEDVADTVTRHRGQHGARARRGVALARRAPRASSAPAAATRIRTTQRDETAAADPRLAARAAPAAAARPRERRAQPARHHRRSSFASPGP